MFGVHNKTIIKMTPAIAAHSIQLVGKLKKFRFWSIALSYRAHNKKAARRRHQTLACCDGSGSSVRCNDCQGPVCGIRTTAIKQGTDGSCSIESAYGALPCGRAVALGMAIVWAEGTKADSAA